MSKSIKEISESINNFANERGWENSDPNQLIASIHIELGELAEHYQWKDNFTKLDEDEKREVGFEFVDVMFYLFRLASKSGIDIEKYFDSKIEKLAVKFPVGADRKTQHDLYRKVGKNKKYE